MTTRQPAVANMFYPGHPQELYASVSGYLADAMSAKQGLAVGQPKVLVLPHAGYMYSGPVAASGYQLLASLRGKIRRVILLGPSHHVALRGIALPTQTAFATPLGNIPLDTQTIARLATKPHAGYLDAAHIQEHSLEVHLPFLQITLENFQLVPMVVGETNPGNVAEILNEVWGGEETLIIISSDLSHYLPYAIANKTDRHTAERIVHLDANLDGAEACGCRPLNGLLLAAKQHKLRAEIIDLRNSGDTAGSKDRVVGYGAFAFYDNI